MSLPVLLLLSLLIVQCGGCDFDRMGVENLRATINSNPTGFRTVFPKDYHVVHHYKKSMLCKPEPCCVFTAAVVLRDSWSVLLRNLWDEHVNHSLILDIKQTLEEIIFKNKNALVLLEDPNFDLDPLPKSYSSPEELLNLTSELFTRWLEVRCLSSIDSCQPPTLPPPVDRKDYSPSRARLLITRAISDVEGNPEKIIDSDKPSSSGGPVSLSSASVWSPLLFRLYWWLLP